MKILRVTMENEGISLEDIADEWRYLGGSGLIAKIISSDVPPMAAVLAEAETEWIFTDAQTGRLRSIPREVSSLFELVPEGQESKNPGHYF